MYRRKLLYMQQKILLKSLIAEYLINNVDSENNYDLSRFQVFNNCTNSIDQVRMETFFTFLNKPELCKQNYVKKSLNIRPFYYFKKGFG